MGVWHFTFIVSTFALVVTASGYVMRDDCYISMRWYLSALPSNWEQVSKIKHRDRLETSNLKCFSIIVVHHDGSLLIFFLLCNQQRRNMTAAWGKVAVRRVNNQVELDWNVVTPATDSGFPPTTTSRPTSWSSNCDWSTRTFQLPGPKFSS